VKGDVRKGQDWGRLREMRERIEEIERLVLDLKKLGKGMPVIEKKARSILSFVQVFRFGVCDVAEITDTRGYLWGR
jgi:hypothetical protein